MAGLSHRGQPPLVRLRLVLRLAGYKLNGFDVFPLRPVRVAMSCAQRNLDVSVEAPTAHRHTVRIGHRFSDAARVLSGLSRDCRRPWRERLLATLAFAAVLAGRAAMVLVPTVGVKFSRGCAIPLRSRMERTSCPACLLYTSPSPRDRQKSR